MQFWGFSFYRVVSVSSSLAVVWLIYLKMRSWSHSDCMIKLPDMIKNIILVCVVCDKGWFHEYMEIGLIFSIWTTSGASVLTSAGYNGR